MSQNEGWDVWAKHVLIELERLNKELIQSNKDSQDIKSGSSKETQEVKAALYTEFRDLRSEVSLQIGQINVEIAQLKVKAGVWGLLAGILGAAIPIAIKMIIGKY